MKILLISISAIILLLFLLPLFMRVHNLATAAGAIYGLSFLLSGIYWEDFGFTAQKYVAFALFAVTAAIILLCRKIKKAGETTADKQKTLVVLGCRVRGSEPSVALEKRVDSAYFYLLGNPESIAILSGGQGKDENLSEAECMKNMLVGRGIDGKRLFLEKRSTSTAENIKFTSRIIKENGFDTDVAVATSEYHQYRTKLICKKYKINAFAVSAKTQPLLLPTFLLRELMAICKEKLLGV